MLISAGAPAVHAPMLLMDIEGSSTRPEHVRDDLQAEAVDLVRRLVHGAGLDRTATAEFERGDGLLVVLPPDASKSRLTDVAMREVPDWLRRFNEQRNDLGRLRLRLGFTFGDASMTKDGNLLGTAVDSLFRLVDSAPAKRALAADPGAVLVLIMSDSWFQEAVAPGLGSTFVDELVELTVYSHGREFPARLALLGRGGSGEAGDGSAAAFGPGSDRQAALIELCATAGLGGLREQILAPAAAGADPDRHEAAAIRLALAGRGIAARQVRGLIREWAVDEPAGVRAVAARALGRRAGAMEAVEAASLLTGLAADDRALVQRAVCAGLVTAVQVELDGRLGGAAVVAGPAGAGAGVGSGVGVGVGADSGSRAGSGAEAEGASGDTDASDTSRTSDPSATAGPAGSGWGSGVDGWPVDLAASWLRHRDGRVRRVARLAALALLTEVEQEAGGVPGPEGSPSPPPADRRGFTLVDRPGAAADDDDLRAAAEAALDQPVAAEPPWPGLLWYADQDPAAGRSVARLWTAVLAASETMRPARAALDLLARRAEPYRPRRIALARLIARAASMYPETGPRWERRADDWSDPRSGAPQTAALVLGVLLRQREREKRRDSPDQPGTSGPPGAAA